MHRNRAHTHSAHRHDRRGLGRWLVLAATLLAGLVLAFVVQAQPGHGHGHGHGHGPHHGGPAAMLFSADTNDDGAISRVEFDALLASVDTDGDGVLSHDELMARARAHADEAGVQMREPGPGADRMRQHVLERLDANDDGQLQVSELVLHFEELDADGDGSVTGDEVPGHGMRHRDHHRAAVGMALRAADTDGDRNVTASEWSAFLATVDADGDGQVTFEEVHQAADPDFEPPSLSLDQVNEVFQQLDANGDGTVSEDELPQRRRGGPRGRRG